MARVKFFTDAVIELREVDLAKVAEYLRCDPKRLQTALKRLAENPSYIEFAPGISVATSSVVDIGNRQVISPRAAERLLAIDAEKEEAANAATPAEVSASVAAVMVSGVALAAELASVAEEDAYADEYAAACLSGAEKAKASLGTKPVSTQADKWLN